MNNFGEQEVATALSTSNQRLDGDTETFVCHTLRGEGFDASEDGTGRGTPLVPVAFQCHGSNVGEMGTMRAGNGSVPFIAQPIPILEVGKGSSSRGAGPNGCGIGTSGDSMFTLQAGAQHAIALDTTQVTSAINRSNPQPGDPCHTLAKGADAPAIAYEENHAHLPLREMRRGDDGPAGSCGDIEVNGINDPMPELHPVAFQTRIARNGRGQPESVCPTLQGAGAGSTSDMRPCIATPSMAVRRLTPGECEKLQGFPVGYTAVEFKGKVAADGPRYRAIGNSMAVPVLEWLGRRIEQVNE